MTLPILIATAHGNSGGTVTFAIDCTGAQILIARGDYWEASDLYTTATYDGVPMIEIDAYQVTPARFRWWYLQNPSAGSHNIVITSTGGGTISATAAAYASINPNNPLGTPVQGHGSTNLSGVVVPGATSNDLILTGLSFFGGNTGILLDAAGTALASDSNGNSRSALASFPASYGVVGPNWSWTSVGSDFWAQGAILLHGTAQTLYLTSNFAPGSLHGALQVEGAPPATSNTSTRWVVGNLNPAALKYARMKFSYKTPSMADFGFSAQPSSGPISVEFLPGDCYRTGKYLGTVEAADWVVSVPLRATATGGSQDGRIRCRIWKGSDPTGANATELTSGVQVGSTVTNLSTSVTQISSLTITMPEFTLDHEYVFVQFAWEITGQGASATCDVAIRQGVEATIITPEFPLEIPGFYALFYPGANFKQPGEFVDLSHRLMAYRSTRGRADALSGIDAGTLQADFDDDDAALDPENTSSPYYPNVKLKRGLQVVAQYGGLSYPRGTIAIDTYAANPLVLGADVSIAGSDLYKQLLQAEVTATYGEEGDSLRIQELMESQSISGSVITSDNAFRVPPASLVKAKLLEHIDLMLKAGRGLFWIGADGVPRYWGRHERLNQESIGTFGAGGDYQLPTPQPVLDDAGLYNRVNVRRTASGVNEVQRITITGSPTDGAFTVGYEGAESYAIGHDSDITFIQTALEAMSTIGPGNVAVSSHSAGFPSVPVNVTFIGDLAFRDVPQMTIVQQAFTGGSSPSVAISTVTNGVDPTQTAEDSDSQGDYGVIPFTLEQAAADLLVSDEEAMNWAEWFAYQHKEPSSRFRVISIDPWTDPANLWPLVLAADFGTVLTINHDLPGTKGMVGENYYIEGTDESLVLGGFPELQLRWLVSKAEADFGHFWVLDETDELETDTTIVF